MKYPSTFLFSSSIYWWMTSILAYNGNNCQQRSTLKPLCLSLFSDNTETNIHIVKLKRSHRVGKTTMTFWVDIRFIVRTMVNSRSSISKSVCSQGQLCLFSKIWTVNKLSLFSLAYFFYERLLLSSKNH